MSKMMPPVKNNTGQYIIEEQKKDNGFCCMPLLNVQKQLISLTQNIDNLVSAINNIEKLVESHNTFINQIQATELKRKVDDLYELKCKGEGGFKVAYFLIGNLIALIVILLKVFKIL